jgi:long-subunit acyl-CoA synthetase (AMP-forming)
VNNVLGFLPSSQRFKHDIQPMAKTSETLYQLKPVTYKYNGDKTARTQYGLIAEEVAKVAPDLVFRDNNGTIQTVRFEQVGAMLLNEFLKEHSTVEQLKSTVAKQEAIIAQLKEDFQSKLVEQQKQIRALSLGLQKVNNQLEVNKAAAQTVANNQ